LRSCAFRLPLGARHGLEDPFHCCNEQVVVQRIENLFVDSGPVHVGCGVGALSRVKGSPAVRCEGTDRLSGEGSCGERHVIRRPREHYRRQLVRKPRSGSRVARAVVVRRVQRGVGDEPDAHRAAVILRQVGQRRSQVARGHPLQHRIQRMLAFQCRLPGGYFPVQRQGQMKQQAEVAAQLALRPRRVYKGSLDLETFRNWFLGGLHKRLDKPKNPRTEKSKRKKEYLNKVASYFGITPTNPFDGKFYFEIIGEEKI
jgi:hypothetical protein